MALSPNGNTLVTHSGIQIELWHISDLRLTKSNDVDGIRSSAVTLSPDGNTLATHWSSVQLRDVSGGKVKAEFEAPDLTTSLCFSSDGKFLAEATSSGVIVRNLVTGKPKVIFGDDTSITFAFRRTTDPDADPGIEYTCDVCNGSRTKKCGLCNGSGLCRRCW